MTSDTLKNNSSSSLMKSSPIDRINNNTENFNPDEITDNKKSSGVNGEVSTQTITTQNLPTFSRQDLGAELSNIIIDNNDNFNPTVCFQPAQHGSPHRFDKFSTENI